MTKNANNPMVSVVIPTLNREEPLCRTLRYFFEQEDYSPFEIIVVDQTRVHRPSTRQFLDVYKDRLKILRPDFKNLPKARNLGVEYAKGEIIVFVDDDVEPAAGFLSAHIEPYHNPSIWGVSGPAPRPGYGLLSKAEVPPIMRKEIESGYGLPCDVQFDFFASHFWGCNMSFRRSAIDAAGGFDENFVGSADGEDTEFCLRVRAAGGRLFYHHKAYLIHKKSASGGCRDIQDIRLTIENRLDNYFHFNKKVCSSAWWKLRILRWFYGHAVLNAATRKDRFLARYYFWKELLARLFLTQWYSGWRSNKKRGKGTICATLDADPCTKHGDTRSASL